MAYKALIKTLIPMGEINRKEYFQKPTPLKKWVALLHAIVHFSISHFFNVTMSHCVSHKISQSNKFGTA